MSSILSLDFLITHFLRVLIPHNPIFTQFFSFFSLKGNAIFVWFLLIISVVIIEELKHPGISRKDSKFVYLFILSFVTVTILVDFPLKNIFQRLRPYTRDMQNNTQYLACPTDYSFPSGHAASAFAASTVLIFFDKKRRWLYLTTALLVSYSRIYLGCHYLSDVIAGALIGYLISRFILLLFSRGTSPSRRKS